MEHIRIALQKSGRLAEDSLDLLKACGLHINRSKDQLFCTIKELPIDLLLVRDDDIPGFVNNGICDLGIVGENVFGEMQAFFQAVEGESFAVEVLERLGFSHCRLVIAVPKSGTIKAVSDLENCVIATSYPYLLRQFLKQHHIKAKALVMKGSVEVAPRLKIADAICDIVASGATLAANDLKELAPVLHSEALFIQSSKPMGGDKQAVITKLLSRIRGVLLARDSKYITMNAPRSALSDIVSILPGCDSPTIMDLNQEGMVAIHAVCTETVFWETMEKLQALGARAILVLPIEKMTSP